MGVFNIFGSKKSKKETKKRPTNEINPDWSANFKRIVRSANQMETDLVEMSEHYCTCGECAKYQGRVYSLSGKSRKYPRIPQIVIDKGYIHKGCQHEFYPYIDGISKPTYHKNIVAYSNSPFADNRTPEEVAEYDAKQKEISDRIRDEKEYKKICEKLPNIAPKSLGGYRKMKKSKSKNYLNLVEECKKVKIKIKED